MTVVNDSHLAALWRLPCVTKLSAVFDVVATLSIVVLPVVYSVTVASFAPDRLREATSSNGV